MPKTKLMEARHARAADKEHRQRMAKINETLAIEAGLLAGMADAMHAQPGKIPEAKVIVALERAAQRLRDAMK